MKHYVKLRDKYLLNLDNTASIILGEETIYCVNSYGIPILRIDSYNHTPQEFKLFKELLINACEDKDIKLH